ncbi:TPA: hypothetical protein ACOD9T_000682 [Stenotrophomonas maltophilia]
MSKEKTTLADVQPGGRVRLGDQAERERFEAWAGKFWSLEKGWWVGQMRYHSDYAQRTWEAWQAALSAQPSPGGQGESVSDEMVDAACRAYYDTAEDAVDVDHTCIEAALKAALAARQPVGEDGQPMVLVSQEVKSQADYDAEITSSVANLLRNNQLGLSGSQPEMVAALLDIAARQPVGEPVCSGGFVISNGSGEKYMAWGQVGPEWTADRSAALWLVRRADAEALAAENEDAWSILPVERCALPPNGWACTLAAGHEGPCPTIAAPPAQQPAQAVDLDAVRALLRRRIEQWRSHLPADPGAPGTREIETKGEHDYNNDVRIYREGIAVMEEVPSKIDGQAVGNG